MGQELGVDEGVETVEFGMGKTNYTVDEQGTWKGAGG